MEIIEMCLLLRPAVPLINDPPPILSPPPHLLLQFRNFKIIYRRYAGLYFCICVDVTDNNLAYLEAIHNFVEVRSAMGEGCLDNIGGAWGRG